MTTLRTVTVDGSPMHVLESGTGAAVLMLHGSGPGTTGFGAWATTAQGLGTSWHLVAPDQAGFGRTAVPAGRNGGLRLWTEQAAGLMNALGVESYAVVGHSMGGAVAMALAAARPQQVTRVVAVSTMGAPGAPLSADLEAIWAAPAGPAGARDMLRRLVLDQALVTDSAVDARAAAMRSGATAFASLFPPPRARWAADLTLSAQTLAEVRAPVLLIHGAEDRVTPLGPAALPLLEHLTDVRLHVLGRCGHVPAIEHPHEFRQLLSSFLSQGRGHRLNSVASSGIAVGPGGSQIEIPPCAGRTTPAM